jgi:hypothetical protein
LSHRVIALINSWLLFAKSDSFFLLPSFFFNAGFLFANTLTFFFFSP